MDRGSAVLSPKVSPPSARLRFSRLALEMLVALSLAFLVWLYIRTRHQESLDHVPIPVQVKLAAELVDGYDLEAEGSRHIIVSFIGPPSRIHDLRGQLGRGEVRVTIPVSVAPTHLHENRYRETVRIHATDVPVPPGVIVHISGGGNHIPVTIRKLGERSLPIRLDHTPDDRISSVEFEPPTIRAKGPLDILEHALCVPTVRYHLPSFSGRGGKLPKELTVNLPLVQELEGRPIRLERESVHVKVTLKAHPRVFPVRNVPVRFLCPASFPYRPQVTAQQPGKVTVRVKASSPVTAADVIAYVDLTQGKAKPGLNVLPVQLQLPKDCVAEESPDPIEFDLIPTQAASGWVVTEP